MKILKYNSDNDPVSDACTRESFERNWPAKGSMGLRHPNRQGRRSDIIVHDVAKGEYLIIDVGISADKNIADKEVEKITKYAKLKIEISRMWGC